MIERDVAKPGPLADGQRLRDVLLVEIERNFQV
jgi:hypothetical protein